MYERRGVKRTRIARSAKLIVPRLSPVIHCTVQDITSGGACLQLANTYGVPPTFELTFEHGRTRRACRIVWRTHDKLGVAFEEARRPRARFPSPPGSAARCLPAATAGDRRLLPK
jgi:PilZ domain